jgi:WD40 repeat protein
MASGSRAQDRQPSLSLVQLLAPPAKPIGSGPTPAMRYSSESPAWNCVFSRNGEWLAACFGSPDPRIQIWKQDGARWVLHSKLEGIHKKSIRSVAFAPISSTEVLAAASFDGSVSIWEYDKQSKEWECTTQLEGHESEVKCVTWNNTGSLLASAGRDKTVWIWETFLDGSIGGSSDNDFECISVLSGHEGDVKNVRFAESHGQWGDGDEILISAGYDDTIRVWAEDAGDWYCAMVIKDIHSDTIWSLAVAPGSGRIISASADGSIAIMKSFTIAERREMFPEQSNCS